MVLFDTFNTSVPSCCLSLHPATYCIMTFHLYPLVFVCCIMCAEVQRSVKDIQEATKMTLKTQKSLKSKIKKGEGREREREQEQESGGGERDKEIV